jgi:uncharacterized damage-inducible protein DinB
MKSNDEIASLVQLVEEGYRRKAWHGRNLRGALRGLTPEQAAWRPGRGRHNVWEIAVHAAYWKYAVTRRLRGEKRGAFPLEGNNWFARPDDAATAAAWRRDLALLEAQHGELLAAIASTSPRALDVPNGRVFTTRQLITGAAMHDIYHAGQIQLLKRLHARTG